MPILTFQTFDDAWDELIQTGHFSLNNAALSLKELYQLYGYVKICSAPLSIYLCDIRLIPTHTIKSDMPSDVLTQAINTLEQTLLNLLNHDRWQLIQLNKIELIENLSLSDDFYYNFLSTSYHNK